MRKYFAEFSVDESTLDKNENEFHSECVWLEGSGIYLKNHFAAETDKDDWDGYLNYLLEWVFVHRVPVNESPLPFEQWQKQR